MKITFEFPREWEIGKVEWIPSKQQLIVEPKFLRAISGATVCFATAEGASGRKSRSVITVSGKTGGLTSTAIKTEPIEVPFDKPAKAVEEAQPEVPPPAVQQRRQPSSVIPED